jgi:hypothetical protein
MKITVSISSSGQQNLMKTYHNEADSGRITKIALKIFLQFFGQSFRNITSLRPNSINKLFLKLK